MTVPSATVRQHEPSLAGATEPAPPANYHQPIQQLSKYPEASDHVLPKDHSTGCCQIELVAATALAKAASATP